MEILLEKIVKVNEWKQKFIETCQINSISFSLLTELTLNKVDNIFHKIKLEKQKISTEEKMNWAKNELLLFYWVLVCESLLTKTTIQNFESNSWDEIHAIFYKKQIYVLKYEAKSFLIQGKQFRRNWNHEEQVLLQNIVKRNINSNKWNHTAKELFRLSGCRYFRQGKHCRERWINHLHVSADRKDVWTHQQDIFLVKNVINYGRKWKIIEKKFKFKKEKRQIQIHFKNLIENKRIQMNSQKISVSKILNQIISELQIQEEEKKQPQQRIRSNHEQNWIQNQDTTNKNSLDRNPSQDTQNMMMTALSNSLMNNCLYSSYPNYYLPQRGFFDFPQIYGLSVNYSSQ